MRECLHNNRGFTLLELMMVVALLGIFFGIIYGFLNNNFKLLNSHNRQQEIQNQARIVMFRIDNQLKRFETLEFVNPRTVRADEAEEIDITTFAQGLDKIHEISCRADGSILFVTIEAEDGLTWTMNFQTNRHYAP